MNSNEQAAPCFRTIVSHQSLRTKANKKLPHSMYATFLILNFNTIYS